MDKLYQIIKTVLFSAGGVLLLVFNEVFWVNDCARLPYLIGPVMIWYGLESAVKVICRKEFRSESLVFLNGLMTLLLGLVVTTGVPNAESGLEIICVLWAVWTIMREGEELYEKVLKTWDAKPIAILNGLESVTVILFSVMLLLEPGKQHAHFHLILLAIELILEVSWEHLYQLYIRIREKKERPE